MNSPLASLPQTVQVRFSGVIWGMTQMVMGHTPSGVMPHWMAQAITQRVARISQVMSRLLLAMQAGTLKTRRSPAPGGARSPSSCRSGTTAEKTMRLPGNYGWLVQRLTWHAVGCGSQLRTVLADPEMVALLAVSPQAVRTLKPLCRMFGVDLPGVPPPTPPTPRAPTPAAPSDGSGPVRQPRRRAARPRPWTPSYNPPLARQAPGAAAERKRALRKTAS